VSELTVWVMNDPLPAARIEAANPRWSHLELRPIADTTVAKVARYARGALFAAPITSEYCVDDERRRMVAAALRTLRPDLVVLGDSHLGVLVPVVRAAAPSARLVLDTFAHVGASWVTQGPDVGEVALRFGADDFGSVMFEENVVSSAGTTFRIDAAAIEQRIRGAGFRAVRRNVKYEWLGAPA
jgi:hypothetical protein